MTSRSTFRPADESVAWQRQLRDRYASEGTPPVPHLDLARSRVREVSRPFARRIISKYEWLGTMGNSGLHFGLFFGDVCAGVTCVALNGGGAAWTTGHEQFGVGRRDVAVLVRGACVHWAPKGTNSRLVSWTVRLLKGRARLVVAFADTDAGEIGTIYQACGWSYIGPSASSIEVVAPNGRILSERWLTALARKNGVGRGRQQRALLDAGFRQQKRTRKHRYACVIDRSDGPLMDRLRAMALPYPKRMNAPERSSPVSTPDGEGGANPTPALRGRP